MTLIETIISNVLNERRIFGSTSASVTQQKIVKSIKEHLPSVITYKAKDDKEGKHTKRRYIFPVAYGLSKAGNEVIRAFQREGDTNTIIPKWKFFRVDRILSWENKTQGYNVDTRNLPNYNPNGDKSMSQVYVWANLGKRKKTSKSSYNQNMPKASDIPTVSIPQEKNTITPTPVTKSNINNLQEPQQNYQKKLEKGTEKDYTSLNTNVAQMVAPSPNPVSKADIGTDARGKQDYSTSTVDNSQMSTNDSFVTKDEVQNDPLEKVRMWNQILNGVPYNSPQTEEDASEDEEDNY